MKLPVMPPVQPMLGTLADQVPEGEGWWFEPKWDGFRILAFRDGSELLLRSRDDKPLLRYFPELEAPLKAALPDRCVVDGEVVIVSDGQLQFESLQMRLHPAKSRIDLLASQIPAAVVLWDVLALGDDDLRAATLQQRRAMLEAEVTANARVRLSPGTTDSDTARDWFARFEGAGFDGVMAKRLEGTYDAGKRSLVKVKHVRTLDCAVAGFRWHKHGKGTEVGSLVLALFNDEGQLHPIGVCSSFRKARRVELVEELAPLREGATEDHPWAAWGAGQEHRPEVKSRWAGGRSLAWEPLRLERVAEVRTTQHSGRRLRHPAKFLRWRTDKTPEDCTMEQLEVVAAAELAELFAADAEE
ncbi:MAG: ATP-dependent DNA ligase [Myxococcales bacterium]|nr:ATP-dependent DNA ligase [Myxococcales bacterium]